MIRKSTLRYLVGLAAAILGFAYILLLSLVILMSYMRSGSTFTGDIFQASPGVFYIYEPLLYVNNDDLISTKSHVRPRLIPKLRHELDPPDLLNYTLDMLSCNFTDHNLRFLLGLDKSKSMEEFLHCKVQQEKIVYGLGECGRKLTERCRKSSTVVSKILRLKMTDADDLLSRDPQIKIIHLVRDPRGIILSRQKVAYYFNSRTFCQRFYVDSEQSAILSRKFPGRILTVRYEDLAKNPLDISKILYGFAGIPWTEAVSTQLKNMTSPVENTFQEVVFSTKRKNSAATAMSWRHQLNLNAARELQALCQDAMARYGYLNFESNEVMRNLSVPTYSDNYDEAYFKGQVLKVETH